MHNTGTLTRRQFAWVFYGVVGVLILAAHVWRVPLTLWRWVNADEFEHLHAAWCVKEGMLLYRDFFEVHTPVFYYGLAAVLGVMSPEVSYERGIAAIIVTRFVMYALTGVILWMIYKLGRQMHSAAAGVMAVLFTLSTMMFIERTIEVRPDVPSVATMLAGVYLTLKVFRGEARRPLATLFLAGALWCIGYLCTPKILMALLGFCPVVLLLLFDPGQRFGRLRPDRMEWGKRAAMGFSLLGGFLTPLALTVLFFAVQGAADEFIHYTFLLGINWKHKLNPWDAAGELAYENPVLVAFGLAGLVWVLAASLFGRSNQRRLKLLPAATTVGVIAGVFLVPVPYTEYMLMPVVFLAIYEAMVLVEMTSLVRRAFKWRAPGLTRSRWRWSVPVGCLAGMAMAWILWTLKPPVAEDGVELCAWGAAMGVATAALWKGQRHAALAVLVVMLSLFPLRRAQTLLNVTNSDQRRRMASVYAHTGPTDPVMDGWHNMAAPFRPHAWYYWFLPIDMRPLVSEEEYRAFRQKLQSGEVAPKVIIMDRDTEALPAHLVEALKERYGPGPVEHVWLRKAGGAAEK